MAPSLIPTASRDLCQGALWHGDFESPAVPPKPLSGRRNTVFLALKPPALIADRAYRIAQNVRDTRGLHCQLVGPERLHVSLLGFDGPGVRSRGGIEALCHLASTVVMPQFRIDLNCMMSFGKKSDDDYNRPFVLAGNDETTAGIVILRRQIIRTLRMAGCRAAIPTNFNPHMTLFWGQHDLGEQPIDELCWTARDFVLIHSFHGLGRHEVLGRWPLQATA